MYKSTTSVSCLMSISAWNCFSVGTPIKHIIKLTNKKNIVIFFIIRSWWTQSPMCTSRVVFLMLVVSPKSISIIVESSWWMREGFWDLSPLHVTSFMMLREFPESRITCSNCFSRRILLLTGISPVLYVFSLWILYFLFLFNRDKNKMKVLLLFFIILIISNDFSCVLLCLLLKDKLFIFL